MSKNNIKKYHETGDKKFLKDFYEQESYTAVHEKIGPKLQRKFKLLLDLMNLQPGEKVLDVGCAKGHFKPYVLERGGVYTGLDLSETFHPDIVGDAEHMPSIADHSYDWVVFADILEHIPHPEKALKEGARVGKKIIAVVPNLYRLNSLTFLPSHPHDKHIIKLRPKQWLKLFEQAKMTITHIQGFFYCVSIAFWPKMGLIDMFFRLPPFLVISDFIDRRFSTKKRWRFLGQELIVVAEKKS